MDAEMKEEPIGGRLSSKERKLFDNTIRSLLASLDSEPALSTRLMLLRVQVAPDNVFEFRAIRYPTQDEWQTVIAHLDIVRQLASRSNIEHQKAAAKKAR